MKAFISATSSISPVRSFGVEKDLTQFNEEEVGYLKAIEPSYRSILNPKMARRMARVIKMGMATALDCLSSAKVENPGAISIGTGLGCLEDTYKFFKQIDDSDEGLLSPTSFIQSTHNTIAGQIALFIGCENQNFTFSNRGFSFENALEDGILKLAEGDDDILIGGIDEITSESIELLELLNCSGKINNSEIPVAGEGASMFMLTNKPDNAIVEIIDIECFFGDNSNVDIISEIEELLNKNGLSEEDLSGIVSGANGLPNDPAFYKSIAGHYNDKPVYEFKKLSGEYFTSTAFGLHVSVDIMHAQKGIETININDNKEGEFKHLLLINNYGNQYRTLILISKP
ncbi:beta-ketoacyl synthase chain length factor [Mangrovivirga sp. M17]|uniref:Beta-ketoacyl synthase chain length factor n=1 Tax=Mangrovivirga halotolerans TaxID=2993936 RepID=A0ABT3RUB8_9BACT|nr:beta-ketoacyl synthase chain length factor [Mangrovivirga halotolerans]MCX2745369.1 beta-ketoacyl synthase chain length factor [Mangrovivirga halotolerans]